MGQLSKDEVFALAVQRYSDTVFRAAMHNCSCTADAEDVVQDVFETPFTSIIMRATRRRRWGGCWAPPPTRC